MACGRLRPFFIDVLVPGCGGFSVPADVSFPVISVERPRNELFGNH